MIDGYVWYVLFVSWHVKFFCWRAHVVPIELQSLVDKEMNDTPIGFVEPETFFYI